MILKIDEMVAGCKLLEGENIIVRKKSSFPSMIIIIYYGCSVDEYFRLT